MLEIVGISIGVFLIIAFEIGFLHYRNLISKYIYKNGNHSFRKLYN